MLSIVLIFPFINFFNVTNGFDSRKKHFFLEPNRRLSSGVSLVDGPYLTRSNVECSLLCEKDPRCKSAEFDKGTSLCKLHGQSSMTQTTETAAGFTVLKDGISMGVTTSVLETTERIPEETSTTANRAQFQMKFDSSTKHQDVYLSTDCMTLSDEYDPNTMQPLSLPDSLPLNNYRGVIVDNCIPTGTAVYFEITYDYAINSQPVHLTVFEIGLAERRRVAYGSYAGKVEIGGWAFAVSKCPYSTSMSVCLEAWHLFVNKFSMAWGLNQIGQRKTGTFKVVVNRKDNSFSLYSNSSSSLLYKFTNVLSNEELCPIFSVHGGILTGYTATIVLSNVHEVVTQP